MPAHEERWVIRGAFANWTMTVRVEPLGDDDEEFPDLDPRLLRDVCLDVVAGCFRQEVNRTELGFNTELLTSGT